MANPNIKFYRKSSAPANPQEGFIWFNTGDRTIQLYKDGDWEKYSGLVNATYTNKILTITNADGTPLTIDLSDVVSGSDISGLSQSLSTLQTNFNTLSGEFTTEKGKISTLQGEMSTVKTEVAKLSDVTGKVGAYVVEKISAHETARESIDSGFNQRIGALETTTGTHTTEIGDLKTLVGTTSVASQITGAINGLDSEKTGDGTFVDVTVKQENGKITSVTVAENNIASASALNDLTTTVNTNKSDLEGKINTEKGRIDALIGTGTGSIRDIAIDVLTETLVDANAEDAYDTLQEMSAWIKSHPGEVAEMNSSISGLQTWRSGLNVADTAVSNQYISEIDQVDGKIVITRASLPTIPDVTAAINALDATVKDEADYIKGSVTQTNGKLTAVSFAATTGSVANNADALAVASDVKSYVDSVWTWAEY